jgi:hypothetical protein
MDYTAKDVPVSVLRLDPGWYLFCVDPMQVADPELLFRSLHSLPGVHGSILPIPPEHLACLSEDEARRLYDELRKRFEVT